MAYVSMMIVDEHHNHPVLRTFVELLHYSSLERRLASVTTGDVNLVLENYPRVLSESQNKAIRKMLCIPKLH